MWYNITVRLIVHIREPAILVLTKCELYCYWQYLAVSISPVWVQLKHNSKLDLECVFF